MCETEVTQELLAGWPLWITDGRGGHVPEKQSHDFKSGKLVCGARIDNSRGVLSDDPGNKKWKSWFEQMPWYKTNVEQGPSSPVAVGNAMEQLVWVAYVSSSRITECNANC